MKKIVAGIDFSKTSMVALEYSLEIARETESDLLLVNVLKHLDYQVPLGADEVRGPRDVVQQFNRLIEEVRERIPGNIEFHIGEGAIAAEISNHAKYSNAWLIIIGAHGLSGFEEFWMGSNSYRIVATAQCPVITVRKDFDSRRGIRRIILPIDSTLETTQKVPFTLDLAKKFSAQVHVLSLYSGSTIEVRELVDGNIHDAMRQVELAGLEMVVESMQAENIANAVIDYARKVDADLISIMTEQEFASRNIFLGPYAQQMVNRSPVPVLSIRSKILSRERYLE